MIEAGALAVSSWCEPQENCLSSHDQRLGEKVATIEIAAIRPDQVDLALVVGPVNIPAGGEPIALEVDADHRPRRVEARPLALHPKYLAGDLKRQVVSAVFSHRLEDWHAESDRGQA
jgi:hypothetical protein